MRLISDGNTLSRLLVRLAEKHEQIAFAVAWASSGTKFLEAININRKKIKYGVIGTHFYQTHPDVLDMFIGFKAVRFVLQPSGVFHPKAYFFGSKSNWDLVIGSANMTNAAFGPNQELSLHISSDDADQTGLGNELQKNIRAMWANGSTMDKQKAKTYREMHKIQRNRIGRLSGNYASQRKSKSPFLSDIMTMPWDKYYSNVQADKTHNVDGRCFILNAARDMFKQYSFDSMSIAWRRAIAGMDDDFDGRDWGWFGSMAGSGTFQNRINANNVNLSKALDLIDLNGVVTYEDYSAFIDEFKKAFPTGRDGVALASRLLALKRPDYFVCVDSKNMKELCKSFGISQIQPSHYERYWTELIVRIFDSVWWNGTPSKNKLEIEVWKGRVAMLDAIFYTP